jgi:outer membrane protein OmpA-like peptidoglycan-associated protein
MQTRLFVSSLVLVGHAAGAQPQADVVDSPPPPSQPVAKFAIEIEPGIATALTDPQSNRTEAGLGSTIKALFGVTRYLEVGPSAGFTTLQSRTPMPTSGTSWAFGGGARVMRPHDGQSYLGASPWVDADLLYVRTGPLDRPGFAAGVGIAIPLDERRQFWVGPYARYFQILQGDPVGFDNHDAKILDLGISLEVGLGMGHRHEATPVAVIEPAVAQPAPIVVLDRDHDGVADGADNCPDVAGPADNGGCPVYAKVVILPDKLQLEEKIAFAWNSAELDDDSRPLLDEVAKALKDNVGFSVKVNGNASSEGDDAHNQVLSEQRATAVLDYLAAHGVSRDRLASQGFSSSMPATSNATAAGRETNRRVEFVVEFIIVKKGNTP